MNKINRWRISLVTRGVRLFKRLVFYLFTCWLLVLVVFKFAPVPYSAMMAERQLKAWFQGDSYYHAEQRWCSWEQISPFMAVAVIAGEDQKFPSHWGFDIDAISAALSHNVSSSGGLRGGSTITQQTAKNLLLWSGRSWLRKVLEIPLTIEIELLWSKQRILTVYLNIVEFGDGIFGVEAAAQHFFHKSAKQLTAEEAALLAAVLPNPHYFRVDAPSRYVRQRQAWILKQMQQLGGIQQLKQLP